MRHSSSILRLYSLIGVLIATSLFASHATPLQADERFSEFEIRVIRPRFFIKSNKLELGTQMIAITNQTFIYTYLLSGMLTYHINEQWALEASGAFGGSVNKQDKNTLDEKFDITTNIVRTSTLLNGGLLWTPVYGKYQLASGRLVYFDTFIGGFFGMTGVDYQYDHCLPQAGVASRSPQLIQYPSFGFGVGQRFFLSRSSSFRWDIRDQFFNISSADGACSEGSDGIISLHDNITIQLGYSIFM